MAGFTIPEDKISEIQNSVDIVDIVSESVLLRQAGRNYQGLCPFHSEKTPSFSVNREKQMFYCFGCGVGGDVFNFLMKRDGLGFADAVEILARRAGIELPEQDLSPEMKKRIEEKESIFAVNKAALDFFRSNLRGPAGRAAKKYLEDRGFNDEAIEAFQLGFAPRGWDNLVGFLVQKKASLEVAEKGGLVAPRRSGDGYYDRFRDRIIFPIFDARKQAVGFGGRVMDDSVPKYLNSPETPVFNKGRNLYGLHLTKGACRSLETVFMVEGYFDLIALYQHGIKNVAATLGTSLTTDHVRLLRGFAKRAILVFDSDEAGAKAAGRSIPLFKKENIEVRVMSLPKGHDPDTFVFEFGADAFMKASEKALGVMAFLTEAAVAKHGLSVEGKLAVLNEMKEHLASVSDPAARFLYTKELAHRIGIDENAVSASIRKSSAKNENAYRPSETMPVEPEGWFGAAEESAATLREKPLPKTEKKIVAMMLQCPEMLPDIVRFNVLDYFENENLKLIGKAIILNHDANGSARTEPSDLFSLLENDRQRSLAASLAMEDEDYWIESESRKRQLIFQFIEAGRLGVEKALIEKIKDAESRDDMALLSKLLSERQKLALACQEQRRAFLGKTPNVNR